MDRLLKSLADVGLQLGAAEDALDEGAAEVAREHVTAAEDGLAALRAQWPALTARERAVLGAAARPVRERLDAVVARVPKRVALSVGAVEADPEQDTDPLGEGAEPRPAARG
jgi:hypothetical protein